MEPTAVIPMTFASPQFWLSVLLIVAVAFLVHTALGAVGKLTNTPAGEKFINPQFVITALLLGLIIFVIWIAFYGPTPASNDIQVAIITAVIINGLPELRKYWLNSTSESEAKNTTIAQQARTAAVTTDALLDPNIVVTGTGDGGRALARATLGSGDGAPPAGAPMQTGDVTVNAVNANVNEVDPKKGQ